MKSFRSALRLVDIRINLATYSVIVMFFGVFMTINGNIPPIAGIPKAQMPGEIDYTKLAGWIGMMVFPMCLNDVFLYRCKSIACYSLLHLTCKSCWSRIKIIGCLVSIILYTTALSLSFLIVYNLRTAILCFLLLTLNLLFWTLLFLICKQAFPMFPGSVCIFCIIFFCYVLGERIGGIVDCLPAFWGMLCRTNVWSEGEAHFELYVLFNILALLASSLVLIILLKNKET